MAAKIIAAVLTLLIDTAVTVIVLFAMLLAMNGFSESDATPGLVIFLLMSIGASVLMAIAAFLLSGTLIKRQFNAIVSTLIAVPILSIVGVIVIVAACFMGIGVAEYVRVNY